jgi:membrane-bound lytic murein transglycosylase MltF
MGSAPSLARILLLGGVAVASWVLPASHDAWATENRKTVLPKLPAWTGDYDVMRKKRVIRVLVPYSKTIFFIDKGEQVGTAVEWGDEFGKWVNKGKKSEIERMRIAFVPTPRDKLIAALDEGRGDVIAANLTITPERLAVVDFTDPVQKRVREILVTGPSAPNIVGLDDLSGKDIYVRKSSSYYEHLVALNADLRSRNLKPIKLTAADEKLEDEDLLEMANAGILPFVVVDDFKARIWAKIFTSLKVRDDVAISDDGAVAAAIRKGSPQLKAMLNKFIAEKTVTYGFAGWVRQRYYGDDKMIRRAYAPRDMERFRQLVAYFRRYGDQYNFDYLMITAQGYQESKLDQAERSKSGAIGIMQIKPSTAREPEVAIDGIDKSAERNIEAGNKYLRFLITKYISDPALDDTNRTLFAFAAYNAGPGGLRKFRDKARAMGLDPNVWFGNVENAAAAVVGRETVQYVSNIYKYFIAYALLTRQLDGEGASVKMKETKQ